MKIMIISNLVSYTYNFRLEIINSLLSKGWEVTVVCDNDSQEKLDSFPSSVKFINVPFNGKGKKISEELALIKRYKKLIKQEKPDTVLTFTIKMNLYGGYACRKAHIPFYPMITGLGELEKEGKLQKLLLFMHKRVMPKARCVFFQNNANISFFDEHGIKCQNKKLVPGSGINLEKFSLLPYPEETDPTAFAFIGRLTDAKGIKEYLDVAQSISSLALFYVAGVCDEKYKKRVEELNSSGIIHYLGVLGDTRPLLQKVHCVVLPTYHPEGMSNVLLEAGASGRPAVCTDRPGCREIIQDSFNGFYCLPENSENLQEVLEKFLVLDYSKKVEMGLNARRHVEKNFDRKAIVSAYIEELEKLNKSQDYKSKNNRRTKCKEQ